MAKKSGRNISGSLAAIRQLEKQTRTITVTARGIDIELKRPNAATYQILAEKAAEHKEDDKKVGWIIDVAALCVAACVPGLTEEEAAEIIPAAGGMSSDLVRESMSLCGADFSMVPIKKDIDKPPAGN